MIDAVDPFIGCEATDLPVPEGLAASWWFPKPQVGNTHPGAVHPFGMVSSCAYSGSYPTGYGLYDLNTEGRPVARHDRYLASGFTHFQQSGTGAIRKYYNYYRVTPMLDPLDLLGTLWTLDEETARPGSYRARLGGRIESELTVGPKSAVHRYTFPAHPDARVVVDVSNGGLDIAHGRTVPMRAALQIVGGNAVTAEIVVEGIPLALHLEWDAPGWRPVLWFDRRLVAGGSRLEFDSIRDTTLRPFGVVLRGPADSGRPVELRMGFSLRGTEQAAANLEADIGPGPGFDRRRAATEATWNEHLGRIRVEGGSAAQRTVFSTALYHSMVKPSFAPDESPFWPMSGPFVFDIATMWDIYKTQLPLLSLIAPEKSDRLIEALLRVSVEEGNFPIGYRMARGADRFFRQASALAHTLFADACERGIPGFDWEWAVVQLDADLRRGYGEEFLTNGVVHPISHTLDLAIGHHCTARIARHLGDHELADRLDVMAARWRAAFDPSTGLLVDSSFYEGGRWNYSFRLLPDMAARIELAGGPDRFGELLDRFFGFGAEPVKQPGERPSHEEMAAGYALDRFEGLNNEPDIEAPWAYHWIGRPDRTTDIVRAVLRNQFGTGRGGLPGNDDSGGLSSWYVWASLGLFPLAGQSRYLLHAPAFGRSRIQRPDGDLVIETDGADPGLDHDRPVHVVGCHVDDRPIDRSWLAAAELRAARRIRFTLADEPADWGRSSPPSAPSSAAVPPAPP